MMGQASLVLAFLRPRTTFILLIEDVGISVPKMPPSILFLGLIPKAGKRAIQLRICLYLLLTNLGSFNVR